MAIKNKLFKFSTLIAVVTIAVIFCVVSERAFDSKYKETHGMSTKTSAKSKLDEKNITKDNDVVNKYTDVSKVINTAEPTNEPAQVNELGFVPIPGEEIPGIDYKQYIDYNNFKNIAIVSTINYVNIRKGPGADYQVIGKIRPNGGCTVLETINVGGVYWSKITSGGVEGYIMTQFLKTGNDALALVSSVGRLVVASRCNGLNVRSQPSLESQVIGQIDAEEVLDIVAVNGEWIEVRVDINTGENSTGTAFIHRDYVTISFRVYEAFKLAQLVVAKQPSSNGEVVIDASSVSELRYNMVTYAQQFIGYNYKYGGTTLTKTPGNGIDCSAFMQNIYSKFGMSLPRTSMEQGAGGTTITREQLRPGDLVFYRFNSSRINHVAMYIGDNMTIHASNPRDGIKYGTLTYAKPYKYVRYIND